MARRIATLVLGFAATYPSLYASSDGPDFDRQIRPILAQHCTKCHGSDRQKGSFRLDLRESATSPAKSDFRPIVPGQPDESELYYRITSTDEEEIMPPVDSGVKGLEDHEKSLLRDWILAGADYAPHWSYVKPVKVAPPTPPGEPNAQPIDCFIRARLAEENLQPSPPASPEVLCRRLYLDLTGLPPTPEDVAAFVMAWRHDRAAAVFALADRLLASHRFGEKWARQWLDLARYGDSSGYQHDDNMPLWRYRDWVINAFNADMPYDEFTREQIAGDLLPNATDEQKIATGFNRCATVTLGADQNADELRAQLIWDRVNVMGTTWLATSLECAQCHTHKFDPIPHTDYYRLYAYFNKSAPEITKEEGSHYFITGGVLELPSSSVRAERREKYENEMTQLIAQMRDTSIDLNIPGGAPLRRIFNGPPESRTPEHAYYYLTEELKGDGPSVLAPYIARLRELGRQLQDALPDRSLVLVEDPNPPTTHVMLRGNVRTLGDVVEPGTLSMLPPAPAGAPPNRLGLAAWLTDENNPLPARVFVNRLWSEIFGQGIVLTTEDFGTQGEFPTHPELLDWLSVDFVENGWRIKRLLKLMVMSETYQQASRITPELLRADPSNRLLARGPRFRLDAEAIRDTALAAAGLLQHEVGGPPVSPSRNLAKRRHEDFNYRRSIYLRHKRGEPYETFASFDMPERFTCSARRPRTNTPLQALALLNEPIFIEAAAALAQRTQDETDFSARVASMYHLCVSRAPSGEELRVFNELFAELREQGLGETGAWKLVANVVLNLDETITKG